MTTAHGTGFDIAGKGIANPQSLTDAVLLAARMAQAPRAASPLPRPPQRGRSG